MDRILLNKEVKTQIKELESELSEKDNIILQYIYILLDLEKLLRIMPTKLLGDDPHNVFGTKTRSCFSCGKVVAAGNRFVNIFAPVIIQE
jgi:hypothetical protein